MIAKFMRKYGWMYIPGLIMLGINSRIATLAPEVLGNAIDLLEQANPIAAEVYRQALYIFLVALAVFVTRFIWRMLIIMNARRMEIFLREELFTKLQSLPLSFFYKQRSGDMVAYAINDVGAVRQIFGPLLSTAVNSIITSFLAIWAMITQVDPKMTLLALIPIPIAATALFMLGNSIQRKSRRVQGLFADLSGFVNEAINGSKVIKSFAREDEWLDEFRRTSDDMRDANVTLTDTSALTNPVNVITIGLGYAISLIIGGKMVLSGEITVGELVAFQGYFTLLAQPLASIGRIVNMSQKGMASYKRLNAIYKEESIPEFELTEHTHPVRGGIEAKNLSFSFPGKDKLSLDNVSFSLPAGGTLGIAGETGSGKTTLAMLLLKLYNPPKGSLFIGGEDVCDIPAKAIRDAVGYVPQDGFLFSTTVAENILFYAPGKNRDDMLRATELAGIRKEIENFPDGFETQVGERGTHLSGGQKQRIALSRALILDAPLLILDDTLSAVDNTTEQLIVGNLDGVLKDKTAVVISHRLSALRTADLILYMENGRILEQGTHDQLIALGGKYADAYYRQARNGGEDDE